MYFSPNGKLAQFTQMVIADVQQGDSLLEQIGIANILSDPEKANSSIKIRTDNATIKIETKTKNDVLHYEIKGHTMLLNTVCAWTINLFVKLRYLLLSVQNMNMVRSTSFIKMMWRNMSYPICVQTK